MKLDRIDLKFGGPNPSLFVQKGDLEDYSAKTQKEIHNLEQASLAECTLN